MNHVHIFGCDDMIPSITKKFNKDTHINHFKDVKHIDSLIMNILNLITNTFKKEDSILLFCKPNAKYIKLFSKELNKYEYIDRTQEYDDFFIKEFLKKTVSKDGLYENTILNMKFDFLISFLEFHSINYKIIDKFTYNNII